MSPTTIITVLNPADAALICSRLEAAGFHPFMPDEISACNMEGYTLSIGGVRIQVPASEAVAAKEFLAAPNE